MSFCFLYNVVLEIHSVQYSPWGGGLLAAHGLFGRQYITQYMPFSMHLMEENKRGGHELLYNASVLFVKIDPRHMNIQ